MNENLDILQFTIFSFIPLPSFTEIQEFKRYIYLNILKHWCFRTNVYCTKN